MCQPGTSQRGELLCLSDHLSLCTSQPPTVDQLDNFLKDFKAKEATGAVVKEGEAKSDQPFGAHSGYHTLYKSAWPAMADLMIQLDDRDGSTLTTAEKRELKTSAKLTAAENRQKQMREAAREAAMEASEGEKLVKKGSKRKFVLSVATITAIPASASCFNAL